MSKKFSIGAGVELCPTCGTELRWIRSALTGNYAPIEVAPSGLGDIHINASGATYSILAQPTSVSSPRYLNHRRLCAMARKGRRGAA